MVNDGVTQYTYFFRAFREQTAVLVLIENPNN